MAYRKKTIRRLSPVAKKIAKLLGELESLEKRLKNLLPEIQRLEKDSFILEYQRQIEKENQEAKSEKSDN